MLGPAAKALEGAARTLFWSVCLELEVLRREAEEVWDKSRMSPRDRSARLPGPPTSGGAFGLHLPFTLISTSFDTSVPSNWRKRWRLRFV